MRLETGVRPGGQSSFARKRTRKGPQRASVESQTLAGPKRSGVVFSVSSLFPAVFPKGRWVGEEPDSPADGGDNARGGGY